MSDIGPQYNPELTKERNKMLAEAMRKQLRDVYAALDEQPINYRMLTGASLFSPKTITALEETGLLSAELRHDLGNYATIGQIGPMIEKGFFTVEEVSGRFGDLDIKFRRYAYIVQDFIGRIEESTEMQIAKENAFAPVNPRTVIDILSADVAQMSRGKGISVDFSTNYAPSADGKLNGEYVGIVYNSVRNILSNAFTSQIKAEKVTLHCSLTDDTLTIEVRDDGVGMSEDRLDPKSDETYIFNKGVSHRGSTGVGLGGVAKRLEERGMGIAVGSNGNAYQVGTSRLENIPESGTIFRVDIPLIKE